MPQIIIFASNTQFLFYILNKTYRKPVVEINVALLGMVAVEFHVVGVVTEVGRRRPIVPATPHAVHIRIVAEATSWKKNRIAIYFTCKQTSFNSIPRCPLIVTIFPQFFKFFYGWHSPIRT